MLDRGGRAPVDLWLAYSQIDLSIDVPAAIGRKHERTREVIAAVAEIYGPAAKTLYCETSLLRNEQSFAIARELKAGARILEIGSAPGPVSGGLSLLGFGLTCLNPNSLYEAYYPSREWMERLNIGVHDFESAALPYGAGTFDAVFFTEVLEHVAIKPVVEVLRDIRRVCQADGVLVLSTPNICNISNVSAFLREENVFWSPDVFYGSLDRQNREFTAKEVLDAVTDSGLSVQDRYCFNCHSNWRTGGIDFAYRLIGEIGDKCPLLRNTIMDVARA